MFRPAIGTLILAAMLAMAGQATAEMPMSPAFRTGEPAVAVKSTEAAAKPQPATGKSVAAKAAHSQHIIATARIPPPPSPASPTAAAATPAMPVPAEHVTASLHKRHHARRRHYAVSRYRYFYPYYAAWGATNPPHLGPNPYSPNGGD